MVTTGAGAEGGDDLHARLARRGPALLLFGMTPPRRSCSPEERQRIADVAVERLAPLDLDALVLYDIADETDRTSQERPFPYLPTTDPADFHADHLGAWTRPVVVYRCVGKYPPDELETWLRRQDPARVGTVFVGAPTRTAPVHTDLVGAQELWSRARPEMALGGVAIPERHTARQPEHQRLLAKQSRGCSFFITQVVYDVNAAKNLVSDYHFACEAAGTAPAPVVFTLSVCGSLKTLAFLQWLGVDVPRWMENALAHARDTLAESYDQCLATARELGAFCDSLGVPHGFNVESVSNRKAEIDASVALARQLRSQD